MKLRKVLPYVAVVCSMMSPSFATPDDTAYRRTVEHWRQHHEAELKAKEGWLTVTGLFWLREGENTFGSGPKNDIVLPASAPAKAGSFEFHAGRTIARINSGVTATLNEKPVRAAELRPDTPTDEIAIGDLTLMVHQSGQRYAIRLKDERSTIRKNFAGLRWFPVDPSYRVKAKWVAYDKPRVVQVQNILGDTGDVEIPGYAALELQGQPVQLQAEVDGAECFIVFKDLTSGHETYGAARFLYADAPRNGAVTLDFNEAYNPPCAYTPYATCPLPLPENRLQVAIEAGEKKYSGSSSH